MSGNYFSNDTIAGIATSLAGDAGVGIIRLSGPSSLKIAQRVTKGFESPAARVLERVLVVSDGEVLDDGLAVLFRENHSFTGEEIVEFQLHGGRVLLQAILQKILETGFCRQALPGEFTFRAVKNGRMSLSQAEGLGQLISAQSAFEIQAARRGISKKRIEVLDDLTEKIRNLLAQSELSIDFIDQDVEVISHSNLGNKLREILFRTETLLEQVLAARRIAKGLEVSLIGNPNSGKSTLFNAILSEDRAIVSETAGTTRDVITEEFQLGPYRIRLADTAGIRETKNAIENEGIERARILAERSDLCLHVIDITTDDDHLLKHSKGDIVVLNKIDRDPKKAEELQRNIAASGHVVCAVSAKEGIGVSQLLSRLRDALDKNNSVGLHSFLATEFQLEMLMNCRVNIQDALTWVEKQGLNRPEMVSAALMAAARALSDVAGETTPDTVLTKIFSEFCIGK